jgi:hypothetical protein
MRGEPELENVLATKETRAMTVWAARTVAFPGLSLLATFCVAGCGTGSGDGHQVTMDAAVDSGAPEGIGGGRTSFASGTKGTPVAAGVARIDASGAAGSTSREEPAMDGGAPDADVAPPAPTCIPEGGLDEPDEDFVDSDCDGIDGDATRAVFVAPSGNDEAEGSMDAPVATVTHAVALAVTTGKSVYLCNAVYPEALELSGTGVNLYGGYACDHGWRRELDRAVLEPPSGIPFVARSVTTPMVVERVAFRAPDAKDLGASSIAASIVGSTQIRFVRAYFQARNGEDGKAGTPVNDPRTRQRSATDAVPLEIADYCVTNRPGGDWYGDPNCVLISEGAIGDPRRCADGSRVNGGNGGYGGSFYWGIPIGAPGSPGIPADEGNGAVGDFGAPGSGFGRISDGRYIASNNGSDGGYGHPGAAGRGGKGGNGVTGNGSPVTTFAPGGGGGQGGYGGCGGPGGRRGLGGGASLAMIVVDSGVAFEWSTLETGNGGKGGNGGDGEPGGSGGPGGAGAAGGGNAFKGDDGEPGADGGTGGSGGPGGGGPSVGIVWRGKAPATSNVTFALGTPGAGGISVGATAKGGMSADIYSPDEAGHGE